MRTRFSTDVLPAHLPQAARIRALAEAMEEQRISFEVSGPEHDFYARFNGVSVGGVDLAVTSASGLYVRRSRNQIAADKNDGLCVFINPSDRLLLVEQEGKQIMLARGEMVVFDQGTPNFTAAPGGGDAVVITIPRRSLDNRLACAEARLMTKVEAGTVPMILLQKYAEAVVAGPDILDGPTAQAVGAHLAELFLLGIGAQDVGDAGALRRASVRAARLSAIHREIDRRAAEPGLGAAEIGRALGISARSVQLILQESGMRLSEEITARRLERSRALLCDPGLRHQSVVDIALACGFNDVSTFYRAFRGRYGCSPRDMREVGTR